MHCSSDEFYVVNSAISVYISLELRPMNVSLEYLKRDEKNENRWQN